ncbi:MAG: hypothetical protein CYPHOPRED_003383 [Cyphobasidiales sp. Tagirdzhanova-0007]|nr:MAG: hypothetical protein CYPHOPRED_003383 [Cyphobasidiales sp. Tagirdzhanova-0007]
MSMLKDTRLVDLLAGVESPSLEGRRTWQLAVIKVDPSVSGIVGLKPTFGLVPYTGIASGEHFVDYAGPITKVIIDAALLLQVLAGSDHLDGYDNLSLSDYPALTAKGIKGFKVGILKESLIVKTTDERVAALVVKAASRFAELGAEVEEVSVPDHLLAPDIWAIVRRLGSTAQCFGRESPRRGHVMNDLMAKFDPWTPTMFGKAFPSIHQQLLTGLYAEANLPATLLGKATNLILKLAHDYDEALSKFDVLITPT